MAEITAVANPIATAPTSSGGALTADPAGPFAALLQQQLANSSMAGVAALLAASSSTTETAADTTTLDLLPLLGLKRITPKTDSVAADSTTEDKKISDTGPDDPLLLIGSPLTPAITPPEPPTIGPASSSRTAGLETDPAKLSNAATVAANLAVSAGMAAQNPAKEMEQKDVMSGPAPQATISAHINSLATTATAQASAPATASTSHAIAATLGSPEWSNHVGDRLAWMAGQQEQRAELILNPPELGRIQVSLSVSGDQASALFVSSNPTVRDAIESALPRLREIFADAGIALDQAQVGADSPSDSGQEQAARNMSGQSANIDRMNTLPLAQTGGSGAWSRGGRGLVDVFA